MKRSLCSSALLVGLSLTAAFSAFAPGIAQAAPEAPKTTPTRVAQVSLGDVAQQPADPSSGTTPAPPPSTAPGSDSSTEPQPAVVVGTTPAPAATPASDQPQAAAEEPKAKPKPRPWAGTQVFAQTSMSTQTVFRGQQQDWNPTVESSLWLLPRYTINKDWQLRGRMIVSYELTDSDSTKTRNEPLLSDAGLQLWYRSIPEIGSTGIKPMVSAWITLPTSKLSRARTMLFSPAISGQLVKQFEHVLGGELMLIGGLTYTHPIYRYTTPGTLDPTPYAFSCMGGMACQDQLSGVLNPSDVLSYSAIIAGEWGKWSPALFFLGSSQWAYSAKEVSFQGRPVEAPPGTQSPNAVRQSTYLSLWLDYHLNSWLTPEVGYFMSRSVLTERGTYGNPLFDPYNDMRVYLGANVNIDNLMKQLEGGEAEAGVVRAQNKHRSMWTF